MAKRDTVKNK